jgi:hypothetical protein
MKIFDNHYLQQMETSSSIKPFFIKLVRGGVVTATIPVDDELDARIEQT